MPRTMRFSTSPAAGRSPPRTRSEQMRFRSGALAGWLIGALAVLTLFALAGLASAEASVGDRIIVLAVAVISGLGVWRATVGGLEVRPDRVVVRSFFWSRRIAVGDVAGGAGASGLWGGGG